MTPAARVAAAIDILDAIQGGQPAEQALTRWARASRFAGSKDRAAVRDHVFDVLRHWRSDALRGGGETGRARMIGRLRAEGIDPATLFTGEGHAPKPLTADETTAGTVPEELGARWNLPDWLLPLWQDSLGDAAAETAQALTDRAPVSVRVNIARTSRADAAQALLADAVQTVENPRAPTALTVWDGARRIRQSKAYLDGLVELQDASSQAAVAALTGSGRALDLCAGGGGKALALAALGWDVTAHDIDARRMRDVPARADRGGHRIALCPPDALKTAGTFDLVFVDAPCSGSGTWRRTPEAKWALTQPRLTALEGMQRDVLETALSHVTSTGKIVYATCSVLMAENEAQVTAFCNRHPDWHVTAQTCWPVDPWGDGFFAAHLTREV